MVGFGENFHLGLGEQAIIDLCAQHLLHHARATDKHELLAAVATSSLLVPSLCSHLIVDALHAWISSTQEDVLLATRGPPRVALLERGGEAGEAPGVLVQRRGGEPASALGPHQTRQRALRRTVQGAQGHRQALRLEPVHKGLKSCAIKRPSCSVHEGADAIALGRRHIYSSSSVAVAVAVAVAVTVAVAAVVVLAVAIGVVPELAVVPVCLTCRGGSRTPPIRGRGQQGGRIHAAKLTLHDLRPGVDAVDQGLHCSQLVLGHEIRLVNQHHIGRLDLLGEQVYHGPSAGRRRRRGGVPCRGVPARCIPTIEPIVGKTGSIDNGHHPPDFGS
mmetsp:Transcript_90770/g.293020  ORF Transcript_90770/g.293020 Transcript_90770/m.293020 type:complete len:332 (-) Transcript_90770:768-1763(-)